MKVLFLCSFLPLEFGSGSAMRSYQLFTALQKQADVDVVSANNWPIKPEALAEFSGNYIGHISIAGRKSFLKKDRSFSKDLLKLVDLDDYDFVFSRYYWPAFWLGLFTLDNLIIDCDDCDLEVLETERRDTKRSWFRRIQSWLNHRAFEGRYVSNLKKAQALIYSRKSPLAEQFSHAFEIPNKLSGARENVSAFITPASEHVNVLFVGVLNYSPNIDGLDHFLDNVWPGVLDKNPNSFLTIVGANIKNKTLKRWSLYKNVEVEGYVRNIEDSYRKADICVVPVYRGGGVHIKIMEAFKYGTPTVISAESRRGYGSKITDGLHTMVATTDEEFIDKLGQLIQSPASRIQMAKDAHSVFTEFFSIDANDPTMEKILKQEKRSSHGDVNPAYT